MSLFEPCPSLSELVRACPSTLCDLVRRVFSTQIPGWRLVPPTLRFPIVLNNLPLDSIGCCGTWKSLFPYRKCRDGWDGIGMGWEGKGCHGKGYHVEKYEKNCVFTNKSHPCIIVAPFWLRHPGLLFVFLFVTWGGTGALWGQSSKQIRKLHKNESKRS